MEMLYEKLNNLNIANAGANQSSDTIEWLRNATNTLERTPDELASWIVVDAKKTTIEMETKFCNSKILNDLLEILEPIKQMTDDQWDQLRRSSNQYEGIGFKSQFVARSALKLANIDYLCNHLFTKPQLSTGRPFVSGNDLMYVADFGGGPGGFIDFLLSKSGWKTVVFGMTPIKENRYKTQYFASESNSFHMFHDPKNECNNIDTETIRAFSKWIQKNTQNVGVHILLADTAINVSLYRESKELLSKRLYLCSCLTALSTLRTDGIFIVKLFDIFTEFSVGLIYLMYSCFQSIAILKPITSRPSSSERYLICKYKRPNTDLIKTHLENLNEVFADDMDDCDLIELVPMDVLQEAKGFVDYITKSNEEIATMRIETFKKLMLFNDYAEVHPCQAQIRLDYMNKWQLAELDTIPLDIDAKKLAENILQSAIDYLSIDLKSLSSTNFPSIFERKNDWFFVPIGSNESSGLTWFLSHGHRKVFMLNKNQQWTPVPDEVGLALPARTLVFGEIVHEYRTNVRFQSNAKSYTFHLIDAIRLGNVKLGNESFLKRSTICHKFITSINVSNKWYKNDQDKRVPQARIKTERKMTLNELEDYVIRSKSNQRTIDGRKMIGLYWDGMNCKLFQPICGLLFINMKRIMNADELQQRHLWIFSDPVNDLTLTTGKDANANIAELNMTNLINHVKKLQNYKATEAKK